MFWKVMRVAVTTTSKCQWCGKEFIHRACENRKFCSVACKNKAAERNVVKQCEHCGKTFTSKARRKQIFCSDECLRKHYADLRINTVCDTCGKPISYTKSTFNRSKNHYCCTECSQAAQRKTKDELKCDYCGKSFTRFHAWSKRRDRHFCSIECRQDWFKEVSQADVSHGEYILEKDGFQHRIVAENMIGRKLLPDEVVHHIDGDRSNNSPDNLVVMTRSEHCRLHVSKRFKKMGGDVK